MIDIKKLFVYCSLITVCVLCFSLAENTNLDDRITSRKIDLKQQKVQFFWKDDQGKIYSSLKNLKTRLETNNKELVFAMNGGMYQKDQSPQGLYIENGKQLSPVNSVKEAYGNFYMQPNGVFYITKSNTAHVCVTDSLDLTTDIKYATQSGPMLIIDGDYHPKFIKGSKNLNVRNGVGILPNGELLFAISKGRINFYDFATFFKEKGCKNALYLDGFVSKAYYPSKGLTELGGAFGVIIGEVTTL